MKKRSKTMTKILDFECPILPTDANIPPVTDPRVKPVIKHLVDQGFMAPDGSAAGNINVKRGIRGKNWIWRFTKEE